jgi:8-oxo-dGTP diphosphatase
MLKRLRHAATAFTPARYLRGSKFVGAGAIIFDPEGKILLIHNRLRGHWEYPAGGASNAESPIETCAREVAEEVGLVLTGYRLIGVDFWRRLTPNGNLLFTFAVQVIEDQDRLVKPDPLEVIAFRWVSRDEAMKLISPRLRARLAELLAAYDADKPVYLHTGMPVV